MQQSIEAFSRQFQEIVRDVDELKKGKRSAIIEQRVRDNLGGVPSSHHQKTYDNGWGIYFPSFGWGEKWKAKTTPPSSRNVVHKPQTSTYNSWPKKDETPKMAFKDNLKPEVEEKGRLITNPTRYSKCNGVGYIAINHPTKRTLVFRQDLNS
ncbi:hypothetical protein M9H77_02988 [Catharanthus roseus]|uniref:Uncharacterized protein n=1 Tax=Catharanthus roseus TaxID=4058 RepID=A0ACC0CA52_CATRO|nr:hypothetical protein M9H77_02988 [Catharanthus roseus]